MNYTFYKLCSSMSPEFYIGSTMNYYTRKHTHKSRCINENSPKNQLKVYAHIRANGGWESWKFDVIDIIMCTKSDALIYEQKYIDLFKPTLNSNNAMITADEKLQNKKNYNLQNKEHIIQQKKAYDSQHKEYKKIYDKERYHKQKLRLGNV